jgi:hypothetical protein
MRSTRRVDDDPSMTRSHRNHRTGDVSFFVLLNLAHAAVAFSTLRLWAELCARWNRAH